MYRSEVDEIVSRYLGYVPQRATEAGKRCPGLSPTPPLLRKGVPEGGGATSSACALSHFGDQ